MQEEEEGCGTTSTAQYYSRYIYWDLYHAQLNALVPKLFPLLFGGGLWQGQKDE